MFAFKPDYETAQRRFDAWWDCQVLDRALAWIAFPKPVEQQAPLPRKAHPTIRDRWMDVEYNAECAAAGAANTVWYADAIPVCYPNLGPEVFSAYFGCELEYTENTSWSIPLLADWSPAALERIRFDPANFYWKKTLALTDAYLERARGKFIVGYTDLHGGADAIAAWRDPQTLCLDLLEHPAEVKALCDRITGEFLRIYDLFHERLSAAGMPSASWIPAPVNGKMHIPSNDFSCMIDDRMFEEFFVPGLERECAHMTRNVYHLDGPGALRFLDRLMAIPKLNAIQWVPGAGRDDWRQWIPVYRRIQKAGKAFIIYPPLDTLDELFAQLRPEGAWVLVRGVERREQAEAALKKIARWGRKGPGLSAGSRGNPADGR
jgi:hypothetical protein